MTTKANKTDAGNGSKAICCVSNVLRSPSPDPSRSPNLKMWTPYEKRNGRKPDFKVRYRFIPHSEGGRVQVPYQGYRSDFHYEGEDMQTDGIYMIWPEFLRPDGTVMLEEETMVPDTGEAFMWILLFDRMRDYHRERALPGRRGWFMEGSRKVAEATIIEQIGLGDSPQPQP